MKTKISQVTNPVTGETTTTFDDGTKTTVHKDGTKTTIGKDGNKVLEDDTSPSRAYYSKHVLKPATLTVKSNTKDAKGNSVVKYTNGTTITVTPQGVILGKKPKVSSHTTDEAGVQTTKYENGIVIKTNPDGTVEVS